MEKPQLVNFIAKVLEDSGFKVYKNFRTSQQVVDIYAVLPTSMGDFGVVVACKNYDQQWEVGVDVLKEMEMVGKTLKASKVTIVTSSSFSTQATRYGTQRNIKLVDRNNLMALAKKFSDKQKNKVNLEQKNRIDENIDQADLNEPYNPDFLSAERYSNPYDSVGDYLSDRNYYESAVGYDSSIKYDYSDDFEDDVYRDEFLNNNVYNSYYSSELANSSSGPSRLGKITGSASKSRFNFRNKKSNEPKVNKNKGQKTAALKSVFNLGNLTRGIRKLAIKLEPLLHNVVSQIILVIIFSFIISFILGAVAKLPSDYLGIIELIIALIISYGLSFYAAENKRNLSSVLIKGTIVFFVSLISLMLLIVILG